MDLDGVCYDFIDATYQMVAGIDSPKWHPTEARSWEFYEDWGMSRKEFLAVCNLAVEAGLMFWRGEPLDNAPAELARLRAAGHSVHILTDRSFGFEAASSQEATASWLATYEMPYDSLTFTPDKTVVQTDYMLDDKLENYDALDAAGCQVYLRNRRWNEMPGDNRRRVDSLGEFVDIVLSR